MSTSYTVIVNTSDGFQDCWEPFFKLFKTYWPGCPARVILNTQRKNWSYPGVDIVCSMVEPDGRDGQLPWSECLLRCLASVPTPFVLYLQEDYFLERPVQGELVDEFATIMSRNEDLKHIGLTHFGAAGPFEPTNDKRLWKIGQRSRYRISTQAGLWRVETLKSYLEPRENAWMFEIYGTRRARRRPETFLTVSRDLYNPLTEPIVSYTQTGIIKGKWHPAIPALFKAHEIEVDFAKRGFYKARHGVLQKVETATRLAADPFGLIKAWWDW